MENEEQNDFRLEGTGFAYTLSLINGKYKMPILYCLSKREVVPVSYTHLTLPTM